MVENSKETGKPFGLRLPATVILEVKQEALRRGVSASALFLEMWRERREKTK